MNPSYLKIILCFCLLPFFQLASAQTFTASVTSGCTPLAVNYSIDSPQAGFTYFWTFLGGDPANALGANVNTTYLSGGDYDVILLLTDPMGNTTLINEPDFIQVIDSPEPLIDVTYSVGDSTAFFTDSGQSADSLFWRFGDGATASGANVQHTYTEDGTYPVALLGYNSCGVDSVSTELSIVTFPMPSFSVSEQVGCAPFSTTFYAHPNTNGRDIVYDWIFEGGEPQIGSGDTVQVNYASAGTYAVTLQASNAVGDTTFTLLDYIEVRDTATADFAFDYTIGDDTALFYTTGLYADSLYWTFGDGLSANGDSVNHTYTTSGDYTVSLRAFGLCGNDSTSQSIQIILPPIPEISASATTGCIPFEVTYTAAPQADGSFYAWNFPGGSPSFSLDSVATVIYNTPGTYDVSLAVANLAGDSTLTLSDYISVSDTPTAEFSFDYTIGADAALFYTTGLDADSLYWTFGDGLSANGDSIHHTYDGFGDYIVTLSVFGLCGMDDSTQDISIITAPIAAISADVTNGCLPLTVNYSATPQASGTIYAWDFPGGNPSFSTNRMVSVTYNTVGSYAVSLAVINAAGDSTLMRSDYITVGTTPIADFAISYTPGELFANFSANSPTADSVYWTFGDGMDGNGIDIQHSYSDAGTYTVTLTVFNDCGSNSQMQELVIIEPPQAGIQADVQSGCGPLSVSFQASVQEDDYTYAWTFEGGEPGTSTAANPTVVFENPGTYDVSLLVTNAAGSAQSNEMGYITVLADPVAAFTVSTNNFAIQLDNQSTDANSYLWTFGDGGMSDEQAPNYSYTADGMYTIQLIATGTCGMDTTTMMVEINGSFPMVNFTASNPTGCAPLTVQYTNTSQNADSLSWTFPGGSPATSTEENPLVIYPAAGTYDATLVATNVVGSSALNQIGIISVADVPMLGNLKLTQNGPEILLAVDSLAAMGNFQWNFGDGTDTTTSTGSVTHTYTLSGDYSPSLTVGNSCGDTTLTVDVSIIIDQVITPAWAENLRLYPNPTQGRVWLDASDWRGSSDMQLQWYNSQGRLIHSQTITTRNGNWREEIPLTNLAAGSYWLRMIWEEGVMGLRMIKL